MNLYVHTINTVVEHIEQNLSEPLTLQSVARQFYLSEYHFGRLFKTITGTSVKQYILGRKLALAAEKIKCTQSSITEVALELGFEYPEVFSRDFKKWFGVSPAAYRNGQNETAPMPKAFIVDRDIMNFQGVLALKETYTYLHEQNLCGICIEVDENADDFYDKLQSAGEGFLTSSQYAGCLKEDYFYTVINCYGDDSGRYSVFYGGEPAHGSRAPHLKIRNIPAGWYVCFSYRGEMLDMLKTFNDDFYKWMSVKEIEPCPNSIGMLTIYDRQDMQNISILVPVKQPK
ncbi:AraC family transcriptional regulator [Acetanaerobacterium elongatum]|uniref:AraC-type DNA-binding protein n=1 Tax=Acetanaerobacterium elongatum TaxID=258515 RepID=A0A1H0FAE7_9FIRM|nr:AraC family transcriptional regulator [Acetanaerobacterium elongatum]SDN91614.1 AraC-type DNA-binding protein [Acetanaerobacterium elongatum]